MFRACCPNRGDLKIIVPKGIWDLIKLFSLMGQQKGERELFNYAAVRSAVRITAT
jgi:hypothetical protein